MDASVAYEQIKADILHFLKTLRSKDPVSADYLQKHLVFDEEKKTFQYTGDRRFKLTPPPEWQ